MGQNVSDDDLLSALGGSNSAPQSSGANVSDEQLLGALGGTAAPSSGIPAPSTKTSGAQPSMLESASAGVRQGLQDVISSIDPIQQWVDKKIGPITLGGLLPSGNQAAAYHAQARNQFQGQYGDSGAATIGRIGGQIAGSLPAMAAGGEVLGPALAGISRAAPTVAPAVDFLTGATKGNKLLQLASKGAAGAGQGAAAAALTSGGSDQPVGQQIQQGAELGATLNTALPAAKALGGKLFDILHSSDIDPDRAALASAAINKYGVNLRGSQISESPFSHFADSATSKLPFSGLSAQNAEQNAAITKAAANLMGEDAPNLKPAVMAAAKTRIGSVYNDVAARTNLQDSDSILAALGDVVSKVSNYATEGELKPIQNMVAQIASTVDPATKTIPGAAFKSLTSQDGMLSSAATTGSPPIRAAAKLMKGVLNQALENSAAPQDIAALKQADQQYKVMKTIEPLAAKSGPTGMLSPALLQGVVNKSYKQRAYMGAGDLGELSDISQAFLKETTNSTTAERSLYYKMLLGGAEGGGALLAFTHPGVLAPVAGALATGKIAGAALRSKVYQRAILGAATKGQGTLNSVLGSRGNSLMSGINPYALPSSVIGARQLQLNQPPESGSQ